MPLPLNINLTIARHLIASRLTGSGPHVPLVLMLELTHACNLNCAGCGRIREYVDTRTARLTLEQARQAMQAANTPVVSISGGEPLLHPDVAAIAQTALSMGKVVYLCTNALLLEKRLAGFKPHKRFYFNVHLDGPQEIHDRLTGLPGTYQRARAGIIAALEAGFGVTTNTTIYKDTPLESILRLFQDLTDLGVDGMMVAPAFAYEVGTEAATFTRQETERYMQALYQAWGDRNLYHSPLYMQFLRGERTLDCMPWGTVTYNPQGWKQPCYLLTDDHVPSFDTLMESTNWEAYGPGRDARCADCMLHSGFEPSVMNSMHGLSDWLQMARWQLGGE
jgi:hopanoid biosynthesis associated radical SAM protein HpnH